MAKRRVIDWEAIAREYRAEQLSIREIARKFAVTEGGIRSKMKRMGVSRDLSTQVANKFRSQVIRISNVGNEQEIVEAAANRAVDVVHYHMDILKRGIGLVDRLMQKVESQLDSDEVPDNIRASTLVSLSLATKNYIDKQRQAFNLDAISTPQPVEETILSVLEMINGQGKVLPTQVEND